MNNSEEGSQIQAPEGRDWVLPAQFRRADAGGACLRRRLVHTMRAPCRRPPREFSVAVEGEGRNGSWRHALESTRSNILT
jgi:hypothetical protein